jgi:hypothetical protein
MLINNQCWICQNTFQKGKKKKVFMVSQLIQVFKDIQAFPGEDSRIKLLTAFEAEAPHISRCWRSFRYFEGVDSRLADAMQSVEVHHWMSGLICARNDLCSVIYAGIFSSDSRDDQIASVQALKGTFTRRVDCPPGCDCGWQFVAA